MIQVQDTTSRNLADICEIHYNGVKGIVTGKLATISGFPKAIKAYLEQPNKLRDIIKALPGDMKSLQKEVRAVASKKKIKNLNKHLQRVFVYNTFSSKKTPIYNAYHLSVLLDVKVCPYCNRQYTFTVLDLDDSYIRPEFDHFLPKEKSALFGLSFYNLIPCCLGCNMRLKFRKEFSIENNIHPYLRSFGKDAVFNYHPADYKSTVGLDSNLTIELEVNQNSADKTLIENNIKAFRLNETYTGHADYVSEIVRKYHVNSSDYLEALHKTFPSITTKEELYRIAFGNYLHENDHEKRVLAKLTKDISKRLNMLDHLESM